MTTPAKPLRQIIAALDKLAIPYVIGDSVASSFHGSPRSTNDVDIVADIRPAMAGALAAEFYAEFYADADMIKDALLRGRAFNIIHLETTYKFDFFPISQDTYRNRELARKVVVHSDVLGEPLELALTSAEDTILAKLDWFKRGGGVSERQWNDVLGVVRIQGNRLDLGYLREWAPRLGVADLLEQVLKAGARPLSATPDPPGTPSS